MPMFAQPLVVQDIKGMPGQNCTQRGEWHQGPQYPGRAQATPYTNTTILFSISLSSSSSTVALAMWSEITVEWG